MSGKYEKKKTTKKQSGKNTRKSVLLLVLVVLLVGALVWLWNLEQVQEILNVGSTQPQVSPTPSVEIAEQADITFTLEQGLEIRGLGSYTGAYMEDGSNDVVSDVLMIQVTNLGEETIQYAKITLSGEAGEAVFSLSTLKPGDTAVVLESNRKSWSGGDSYDTAEASNVAWFYEELTCYEDRIQIQPLDGGLNIRNISDEDINGEIIVYFKNYVDGLYYGGITYRGRIEGGLGAGEVKQIMSKNFSEDNTLVMFVTISEE